MSIASMAPIISDVFIVCVCVCVCVCVRACVRACVRVYYVVFIVYMLSCVFHSGKEDSCSQLLYYVVLQCT